MKTIAGLRPLSTQLCNKTPLKRGFCYTIVQAVLFRVNAGKALKICRHTAAWLATRVDSKLVQPVQRRCDSWLAAIAASTAFSSLLSEIVSSLAVHGVGRATGGSRSQGSKDVDIESRIGPLREIVTFEKWLQNQFVFKRDTIPKPSA